MVNLISIKVDGEYYDLLRKECVEQLFKEKPELKTLNKNMFSARGMFQRVVNFYLGREQKP